MSIPKKGSRRVVVDDIEYRWRVRSRPTYDQALGDASLLLAIEQAGRRGAVLVVTLSQPHPSNWMLKPSEAVTPARVAEYIRKALSDGWCPAVSGAQFLMDAREGARC
jgi:hypothetical protein